jgi:hypothetical protein
MEVLHRNITEALRIHPPLLLVMRYAKQPFSVTTSKGKTYHVPAVRGWWGGVAAQRCREASSARKRASFPLAPWRFGPALRPSHLPTHPPTPDPFPPPPQPPGRHRRGVPQLQPRAADRLRAAPRVRARALCAAARGGQAQGVLVHRLRRRPPRVHRPELRVPPDQGDLERAAGAGRWESGAGRGPGCREARRSCGSGGRSGPFPPAAPPVPPPLAPVAPLSPLVPPHPHPQPQPHPPPPQRNFDFELLDPVPDADYDSMVIGPKACRVKYTRRKLAPASA